jgi:peptidoglycan/LPS O-acetylase OafA/YrhL
MRTNQLTFTRFIAAFSIILYHYSHHIFPFTLEPIQTIISNSNVGVSYFYLLSGFVLSIAYVNKNKINTFEFYKNRIARIYPLYLFASILIFVSYLLSGQMNNYKGLVLNLLMIQAWVPSESILFHSQGWSISVEFFFYLTFPFLLKYIYKKISLNVLIFYSILFWVINQIVFNSLLLSDFYKGFLTQSHNFLFYFPLFHLNEFILGNILGIVFLKKNESEMKNYDIPIIVLFAILLAYLSYPQKWSSHNGLLAIIFIPIIFMLSMNSGKITELFSRKIFVFLGEMSFGMYILQYPVFIWTISLLKRLNIHNNTLYFYITIPVLLFCSAFSYIYIEKPARDMIKNMKL